MKYIQVLDGTNTIGGNKILIESRFFFDFGFNFSTSKKFFEPYLKPRSSRGIRDFLKSGMLPYFNIYRSDAVMKEDELQLLPLSIEAVFISHAHKDHVGMVPFLREDIPIITSKDTLAIVKNIEQYSAGRDPFLNDYTVFRKRNPHFNLTRETARRRFIVEPEGNIGNIKYKQFEVDHSILGSSGFYVETPYSSYVYTGDFNLHGWIRDVTIDGFKKVAEKSPEYLIIEGTNVGTNYEQEFQGKKEADLVDTFIDIVKKTRGIAVFDITTKNIPRIFTILKVAQEAGRKIVITAEIATLLQSLNFDLSYFTLFNEIRLSNPSYVNSLSKKMESVTYYKINRHPEDYILCFGYYDIQNLFDLNVKDGSYIYSRTEPFDEEGELSKDRLNNWINTVGIKIVEDPKLHVSGHATVDEIRQVVEIVNPKYIVPVHTQYPEVFKKIFKDKVLLPGEEKGSQVFISDSER
jgi:ribonuclease J